jgi:cation transport regulator ChaC
VRAHLDHREKGGYTSVEELFHPDDDTIDPFPLTIYMATETNTEYLGPAPITQIARQIVNSVGPSGKNTEYLLNLAKAVRKISPHVHDSHLFELETEVLKLCEELIE